MKFLLQARWIGAAVGAERLPETGAPGAKHQDRPAPWEYLLPGTAIGDADGIEPKGGEGLKGWARPGQLVHGDSGSGRVAVSLEGMQPSLTHLALQVKHLDACVAFYREFCGLNVVHSRESSRKNDRVVWLAENGRETELVLVLIPGGSGRAQAPEDYSYGQPLGPGGAP